MSWFRDLSAHLGFLLCRFHYNFQAEMLSETKEQLQTDDKTVKQHDETRQQQ